MARREENGTKRASTNHLHVGVADVIYTYIVLLIM